jgi:hypothetical protein
MREPESSGILLLGEGRRSLQQFVIAYVWSNTDCLPLVRRNILQLPQELRKNKET